MNKSIRVLVIFSAFFLNSILLLQAQTPYFRIMTYNIRYANENQGEEWSKRKNGITAVIKLADPDILGVQEAIHKQIIFLNNSLSDYNYVGVGRDDGKTEGEYSAIFYKTSKFTVQSSGTFWLSETPDKPSKGWDAAFPRICTWAKFNITDKEKSISVYNTHFDHIGLKSRNNAAQMILDSIKSADRNIVVMGDFNSRDTSLVYKIITGSNYPIELVDTRSVSESGLYGEDYTFNGFGNSILPGNIIDFIFVSQNIGVKNHYTLGGKFNRNYPSDHLPVIADTQLD